MKRDRLTRLKTLMEEHELEVFALNPGSTLYYLTGLSFHLMERPVLLIIPLDAPVCLVLPELEAVRLEGADVEAQIYSYDESPASRVEALNRAAKSLPGKQLKIAVEPLRLRYFELELMRQVSPSWIFCSGEKALEELRSIKEPSELKSMERAVQIAETALTEALPHLQIGMSEFEVGSLLTIKLLESGSDPSLPFDPIVASGPNSAIPHATPTERQLKSGELLLIDWGARYDGYISDLTRTFALGEVADELKEIHAIVHEANQTGLKSVKPGISCGMVDETTRKVIVEKGYGDWFIHRTGHGIGLETHEPPYIRSDNQLGLSSGMTFTIEPGIYLPGKGGVRIEDDIVTTESGGRSLSTISRELLVLE